MAKMNEIDPNIVNKITAGTTITGDIISNGDIRIDGILKGNLNTKGKVVVGNEGSLKGEIICKNADISGKVDGKLKVKELLSLSKTATIYGEINTGRLAIEPGAIFSGSCTMDSTAPLISSDTSPKGNGDKNK